MSDEKEQDRRLFFPFEFFGLGSNDVCLMCAEDPVKFIPYLHFTDTHCKFLSSLSLLTQFMHGSLSLVQLDCLHFLSCLFSIGQCLVEPISHNYIL